MGLRDLEEKKAQVNNPTRWIKKAAESSGFLDEKVKRTIWWYNDNGNLAQPIHYDEVKKLLGQLSPWKACKVLSTLADGKGEPIRDPTSWICKAACPSLVAMVVHARGRRKPGGRGRERASASGSHNNHNN